MPWRTAPPAQKVSAHRGGSGRGDPIALRTCFLHGKGNKFPGQKGFYPVTLLFSRLYSVNSRPLRRLLADSRPAAHWLDKRSAGPQSVPPSPVGTFLCRTMALQAAKTLSSARSFRVVRFPISSRLPQRGRKALFDCTGGAKTGTDGGGHRGKTPQIFVSSHSLHRFFPEYAAVFFSMTFLKRHVQKTAARRPLKGQGGICIAKADILQKRGGLSPPLFCAPYIFR